MPYSDPEKRRAAKRESAQRRRTANPEASRAYDRTQKQLRRVEQGAGGSVTSREIELGIRYPERSINSVRLSFGRRTDLRTWIEVTHAGEERDEPEWDDWRPLAGYDRFNAPFDYDEEERIWHAYYCMFITPPMERVLRLDARPGRSRRSLPDADEGPDTWESSWLREYGPRGEKRAIEVAATLASEPLDVRRVARYMRHHPTTWYRLYSRQRLPRERLDRAIDRLRRLGYLSRESDLIC